MSSGDELGRPCLSWPDAVEFVDGVRQTKAAEHAELDRMAAQQAPPVRPRGVPAIEGLDSGFEVLMAQADYVTPSGEYGLPKPTFLDDELAAGKRHLAEVKDRAAAKLKDTLTGKDRT